MAVGGLFQLTDVVAGFTQASKVQFFDADITHAMEEGDLPKQLQNWALVDRDDSYKVRTRDHGSDLGRRSDVWQYRAPNCNAIVSLDQTFPGWHELTTCYRNSGWNMVDRSVIRERDLPEGEAPWDTVEALFKKETGEQAYLLFSHFNGAGEPENAPVNIGTLESFLTKAKNRLSNRIRRSLFSSETYQVQAFVQHYGDLEPDVKKRGSGNATGKQEKLLRQKFVERTGEAK